MISIALQRERVSALLVVELKLSKVIPGTCIFVRRTNNRASFPPEASARSKYSAAGTQFRSDVPGSAGSDAGGEAVRVSNFELKRDAGTFRLRLGTVCFATPVQGRVTGTVFVGDGNFVLDPPSAASAAL